MNTDAFKPTKAFITISLLAMGVGVGAYMIGLLNANMELNEKGYYFAVIMYSLYSGVSVQKSIRDRAEGLPVNQSYYVLSLVSVLLSVGLLIVGLFNADLMMSEKGFFAMAFGLSVFASIAVQKNLRDVDLVNRAQKDYLSESTSQAAHVLGEAE